MTTRLLLVFCVISGILVAGCAEPDRPSVSLYRAVQIGDIDQIERHLYWGTDINAPDAQGNTPLHVAADRGRWAVVRLLLEHGAEIDARNAEGQTPINSALLKGRTQVAELLLQHGAQLDPTRALHDAAVRQIADRDVIRFLVEHGGNINGVAENGNTPLHQAVAEGNRVIAKFLIAQGADVNAPNGAGKTPLDVALESRDADLVRLLQSQGGVSAASR